MGWHQTRDVEQASLYRATLNFVEAVFRGLDRIANRLFTSEYNPLYKSGTIAVVLMSLVTITGFILVFFYRLSEPYESVKWLTENHFLVGWLRSLHRYASGAAALAVLLHAFRMFAQGKSWGPRTFSWITGLLLLVFLFVSGWTGYVMVWDEHALALVTVGAKMIDSTGLLADPISRSFNGVADQPPGSFFFLNLFLHVVVPLGMIFGTWIHTSRMARASWFPPKKLLYSLISLYTLIAFLFPAVLGPKADMLRLPAEVSADWFYSFFVPAAAEFPGGAMLGWVAVFLILASFPFWLKPKMKKPIPAHNEEKRCLGCVQCVVDCPYEAIKMIPRRDNGSLSKEVAVVIDDLCVSCGLCAGSCPPMTIGVPQMKGGDHYALAKDFVAEIKKQHGDSRKLNIVIGCQNQKGTLGRLRVQTDVRELPAVVFPTECMGTLHMGVVEYLAQHFQYLFLAACPERNCSNKDAHFLLKERLEGRREPHLLGRVSRDRIILVPTGDGEEEAVLRSLKTGEAPRKRDALGSWMPAFLGFIFLLALSRMSVMAMEMDADYSVLRLSWRLTGQIEEVCRDRSADELAKLSTHMRTLRACERTMTDYQLKVSKDGELLVDEVVRSGGLHQDRPLYVDRDLRFAPGEATFNISFRPLNQSGQFKSFQFERKVSLAKGRIVLIYLSPDQDQLLLKEGL